MEITWPQLLTVLGFLGTAVAGVITWLAKRDAKRSDDCEKRVGTLEAAFAALSDKYVTRLELLLQRSFESNENVAKALNRVADQLDEQRQSFPRLMREAAATTIVEFKRGDR